MLSMELTSNRMSRLGKSLVTDSELLSLDQILAEIDAVDAESVGAARRRAARARRALGRRDRDERGPVPRLGAGDRARTWARPGRPERARVGGLCVAERLSCSARADDLLEQALGRPTCDRSATDRISKPALRRPVGSTRRITRAAVRWRGSCATAAAPATLPRCATAYIEPYVTPDTGRPRDRGSGGGRWTRYLLGARKIVVVRAEPRVLPVSPGALSGRRRTSWSSTRRRATSCPASRDESIDFVFSFGAFVHIDPEGIDAYLGEIRRRLRPGGTATIHYGDRSKKFFDWPPPGCGVLGHGARKMEGFLQSHGVEVLTHDRRAARTTRT